MTEADDDAAAEAAVLQHLMNRAGPTAPSPAWDSGHGVLLNDDALEALVSRAAAAARRSAARDHDVGDELTALGRELRIDQMGGLHRLEGSGNSCVYKASVDVPGVLPRLTIQSEALGMPPRACGPVVPFRTKTLAERLRARSRAPGVLRVFDTDEFADLLDPAEDWELRIEFRPETDKLTVIEVDVDVGDGRHCNPALRLTEAVARIARALVESGAVFAEIAVDGRPPAERIEALLGRITEAVSWVHGPVARVGDGVEARLALEEQPDAPSVLRLDLHNLQHAADGHGSCSVFFEGRLIERTDRSVRLTPQVGVTDRLRGLVDVKVKDAAFDAAWLISGDEALSKKLAAQALLMQRLRAHLATVELTPAGLVVRVPPFADEDSAVVEVVSAVLTLWRHLCRDARGFSEAPPA